MTHAYANFSVAEQRILEQVPDHSGKPRDPSRDLFAKPAKEIGEVWSADSSLKTGKDGWSSTARLALVLIVAVLAFAGTFALSMADPNMRENDKVGVYIVGGAVALLGPILAWWVTSFSATANFVGQKGAHEIKLSRNRANPPAERLLQFDQAEELRVGQTRHYYNGVYTGTSYSFVWSNAAGQKLFDVVGRHNSSKGTPKAGARYYFATAAEIAWSKHYLERAARQLEQQGAIAFRIDANRVVCVGPGFLEFHFGGPPQRVTKAEIAQVSLSQGQFSFKNVDAKWYSRDGKFKFPYAKMANARVFILALDKLMGYRWS